MSPLEEADIEIPFRQQVVGTVMYVEHLADKNPVPESDLEKVYDFSSHEANATDESIAAHWQWRIQRPIWRALFPAFGEDEWTEADLNVLRQEFVNAVLCDSFARKLNADDSRQLMNAYRIPRTHLHATHGLGTPFPPRND